MSDFDRREYQTVILAALLHDIGKLHGWVESRRKGKHPIVSSEFVADRLYKKATEDGWINQQLLATLVQRHHEHPMLDADLLVQNIETPHERALAYIVSSSDSCSSGERDESERSRIYFKRARILSVLTRVDIMRGGTQRRHHNLKRLSPDAAFPIKFKTKEDLKGSYTELATQFDQEIDKLRPTSFERLFNGYLSILRDFLWCVPSDTRSIYRDISLFDHLSTSSAIAACLYRCHWRKLDEKEIKDVSKQKFLLAAGDLCGIQSFLFEIGSTNPKKLSKILRGRSFYLSLLTEIASLHILRRLDLPLSCRIMDAAGRFVLLIPNTDDAKKALKSAVETIGSWMFARFLGKLSLNIAHDTSLTIKDFRRDNFGTKYRAMGQDVELAKSQRYSGLFSRDEADGPMREAYNALHRDGEACEFCQVYPRAESGAARCQICLDSEELGRRLVNSKTKHLYVYEGINPECVTMFGYSLSFGKRADDWLIMEKLDRDEEAVNPGYVKRDLARYIPRKKHGDIDLSREAPEYGDSLCGYCASHCSLAETVDSKGDKVPARKDLVSETLTFQCLAASARRKNRGKGVDHLAVLKADIDDTGIVFSQGLGDNFSISRYATLSRMINYFFTGWLTSEIERAYPMTYTIYAGGDDLVLIAPWEDALEIGRVIVGSFKEYVGCNPNLTISEGVSLMRPGSPVAWGVKRADEFLETSKRAPDKNSLTVFDTTVSCQSLTGPYEFMKSLHAEYGNPDSGINTSFMYRLLKYHNMYRDSQKGFVQGLKFHSAMTRDVRRNIEKKDKGGAVVNKRIVSELESLCAVGRRFNSRLMDTLKIPVYWALYKNRGGGR